uniref:Lipase_3 domain-containing protein n=1 Tax=Panagrellus redivivus TaxID=6233 RepID=A0A7E4V7Z8_PANRE
MASCVFTAVCFALLGMAAASCGNSATCESCVAQLGCFFNAVTNACQSKGLFNINSSNGTAFVDRAYDCPRPLADYDDDFARNVAYVYAAASNGNVQEIQACLNNRIPGAVVVSQYTVPCDIFKSNCSGYVALNHENETITVVFRGTKGSTQFYYEAINLILYLDKEVPFFGGQVFSYFLNAFQLLWDAGIGEDLEELSILYPYYELQAFGHSLGGSLASLTALAAVKKNYFHSDNVLLYTFGQPRTGDVKYATEHDENVPNSFRIVHAEDLVSQAPLRLGYYQTTAYHHRY